MRRKSSYQKLKEENERLRHWVHEMAMETEEGKMYGLGYKNSFGMRRMFESAMWSGTIVGVEEDSKGVMYHIKLNECNTASST